MNPEVKMIQEKVNQHAETIKTIQEEMSRVIVGQKELMQRLLVALFTHGHILLEGVPGLAKTTAISTLAKILKLDFQRIQFTPDLLPSDLIGSKVFNIKDSSFFTKKGPIFANLILADEINRSPAKVQSALLEAMQERQVTIGEETYKLEEPFFVMATQNPIEQEGTYPLPEAQVDRFLLKTVITYPTREEELQIIDNIEQINTQKVRKTVSHKELLTIQELTKEIYVDKSIKQYITDIVFASRYPKELQVDNLESLISYGASPRASIGLLQCAKAVALLNGRSYVIPEDIKEIAMDVLRHRVIPTYEAEAEGVTNDDLVEIILNAIRVP
jgi:MoxR-like ATPase